MKIAVGYVRCSTDMQDDSIDQQKRAIETWAIANEYKVIEWFEDEGKSGTSFEKRSEFMRLVHRAENSPNFEHILVYDESRWGRAGNPRTSTYWKIHFERHGAKVKIINSQSKNENDIGSFVTEVVECAEASEYSKKLSRSTMRGCVAHVEKGWSAGGSAPYGYKRVAIDPVTGKHLRDLLDGMHRRKGEEVVRLELGDRNEVDVVKRIFELKEMGNGLKTIADTLNFEGISCPRRGKWKNKDQKWSCGTIRSIIQNPVYCGTRVYNRFPKNKLSGLPRGKRNDTTEWKTFNNAHPSIISKERFDQANISKSYKYGGGSAKAVKSPYLLSGLVRCAHCGFNYSGYTRGKKGLRYYADSGFISKGKSVCEWHAISKDQLEGEVLKTIREKLFESVVPRKLEERIEEFLSSRQNALASGGITIIESQLNQNQAKLENLLLAVEKGLELNTVLPRIKQIEADNERLRHEMFRSQQVTINQAMVKNAASDAARFIVTLTKNLESFPVADQKLMLRRVVDGLIVDRAQDSIFFNLLILPKLENPILKAIHQNGVVQSRVCPEQDLNLHDLAATRP